MDHKVGHEFEFVDEQMEKGLQCPICTFILRDPVEVSCLHTFCRECLNRWEKEKNKRFRKHPILCPLCNVQYDVEMTHNSGTFDRFIRTMIKVKCQQYKEGCEWTGYIDDYYDHHQEKCLFVETVCPLADCGTVVKRGNMQQHAVYCIYRSVECELCRKMLKFYETQKHLLECPRALVNCKNDDCIQRMKRCEAKKSEMDKHCADNVQQHLLSMLADTKATKADNAEKTSRLKRVEEKLIAAEQREADLVKKLQSAEMKIEKSEERQKFIEKRFVSLEEETNKLLERLRNKKEKF